MELNSLVGQVFHHRQARQVVSLRDRLKQGHAADVQIFFLHMVDMETEFEILLLDHRLRDVDQVLYSLHDGECQWT